VDTVLLPDDTDAVKRQWAVGNNALKPMGRPDDVARTSRYRMEEDFATSAGHWVGGWALV